MPTTAGSICFKYSKLTNPFLHAITMWRLSTTKIVSLCLIDTSKVAER